MLRRVNAQARQMDEVMERLGIDLLAAVRRGRGALFAEARLNCIHCSSALQCRLWLDASSVLREAPVFCPNANFFRQFGTGGRQPPLAEEKKHPRITLT
jgi:hypothetical protein